MNRSDLEDSESNSQQFAFQNHLILKKLFTFFDVTTLKHVRRVCYAWYSIATTELLRNSSVVLLTDEGHWNDLSRGIEFVEQNPSFQVINWKLKYMNLTDKNNRKTRVIELLEKFGKTMKSLHIKRSCLDWDSELWRNLVHKSKWTPNLQELILEQNCYIKNSELDGPQSLEEPSVNRIQTLRFMSDKSSSTMPCSLPHFLELFPSLHRLQLTDLEEDENLEILDSMLPSKEKSQRTPNPKFQIQDLDIFGELEYSVRELPSNQLQMLCDAKLPLTKLTIDIGEYIMTGNFQQLLITYAPTLKELIIWRGLLSNRMLSPGFPFGVKLPVVEHLAVPESCIINFNFIHFLPRVRHLVIRQCDLNPIPYETDVFNFRYSFQDWKAFVLNPQRTLTSLEVEFRISDEDTEFLRGIFPNLRVLSAFREQSYEVMTF